MAESPRTFQLVDLLLPVLDVVAERRLLGEGGDVADKIAGITFPVRRKTMESTLPAGDPDKGG